MLTRNEYLEKSHLLANNIKVLGEEILDRLTWLQYKKIHTKWNYDNNLEVVRKVSKSKQLRDLAKKADKAWADRQVFHETYPKDQGLKKETIS